MRISGLGKALAALGLMMASASASAQSWVTHVQDDLFSETGKSAMLIGSSGEEYHGLVFECSASKVNFAFLSNEPQTPDESSNFSVPTLLVIKVDDEQPIRFDASWSRRNQRWVHATVSENYSSDTLTLLNQIKAARSKVVVGTATRGHSSTLTFGVSGSTVATTRFMEVCGIKE